MKRGQQHRQFIGANAAAMRHHSGCTRGETARGRFVYELAIQQNKNFVESSGGELQIYWMCRRMWDLRSELRCMLLEEIKIQANVFQRCPRFRLHRISVQVIDPRIPYGQQKRRMCGNDKLTAKETHRILKEPLQIYLPCR